MIINIIWNKWAGTWLWYHKLSTMVYELQNSSRIIVSVSVQESKWKNAHVVRHHRLHEKLSKCPFFYTVWLSGKKKKKNNTTCLPMLETQALSLGWNYFLGRELQPTPVSLSRKSHGQRSLLGYSPWSSKESDTA